MSYFSLLSPYRCLKVCRRMAFGTLGGSLSSSLSSIWLSYFLFLTSFSSLSELDRTFHFWAIMESSSFFDISAATIRCVSDVTNIINFPSPNTVSIIFFDRKLICIRDSTNPWSLFDILCSGVTTVSVNVERNYSFNYLFFAIVVLLKIFSTYVWRSWCVYCRISGRNCSGPNKDFLTRIASMSL